MVNCTVCDNSVEKTHTTKDHLENDLQGTIECYERENYNHGNSDFAQRLLKDIAELEIKIKNL